MSATGACSITMPMFIVDVLKDVKLGTVVTPASGDLVMTNESSPLYIHCSCIPDDQCNKDYR